MTLPLKEIWLKYVEWVCRNPQATADIESSVKWMSYFLAGRVSNSAILTELVYSMSNLVTLFNDNIIRKSQHVSSYGSGDTLKTWLTVLEYSEVFIEVSAFHSWGATGRWIVISVIQTFKCIAKLVLLYHYKENIVQNPPVVPLKRSEVNKPVIDLPPEGFTLSSGRVIRTVESSGPMTYRTWKPPEIPKTNISKEDTELVPSQLVGEVLYLTKPLAHLVAMYRFGPQSWRPWLLAFGMDLVSLHVLKAPSARMSLRQSKELSRRQISLLMYLLRSPFYESQTRDRLQRLLASCATNIPFASFVCKPLAEYLPYWQRVYFYLWST